MGYTNNTTTATDREAIAAHYATHYHRGEVHNLIHDLQTLAASGADAETIAEAVADIRRAVTDLAACARSQARIVRGGR